MKTTPALPDYARGHGSPTILIDERDVAADHPKASSCRLYEQGDGTLHPAPPVAAIITALRARTEPPQSRELPKPQMSAEEHTGFPRCKKH
jgi:hypothetical protein